MKKRLKLVTMTGIIALLFSACSIKADTEESLKQELESAQSEITERDIKESIEESLREELNETARQVMENDTKVDQADDQSQESLAENPDEYILPYSNTKTLTENDISGLSQDDLRIAKNEIYARHGRKFQSEDLQRYFEGKSWYQGTISAESFNEIVLNQIEKDNVAFIASYQDSSQKSNFEKDWIYGTYQYNGKMMYAEAEIGWYSDSGNDYILLNGVTEDARGIGEFLGVVISSNGNNFTAMDEDGYILVFSYNGSDSLEVTDDNGGTGIYGLYFHGFTGTYKKIKDLPKNVS